MRSVVALVEFRSAHALCFLMVDFSSLFNAGVPEPARVNKEENLVVRRCGLVHRCGAAMVTDEKRILT